MKKEAYFATAEELARGGLEAIPPQMISGKHLIYQLSWQLWHLTLRERRALA